MTNDKRCKQLPTNDGRPVVSRKSLVISPKSGFTLLEVMIVVAILAIIMGVTMSSGFGFYNNQSLIGERDGLVSLLRHARGRAMNNMNQSSHGVYISTSTNQYILFQGASY